MFVTVEFLRKLDVCEEQVELFAAVFPDGAMVTRESLTLAQKAGLNVDWFGALVFNGEYLAAISPADHASRMAAYDITLKRIAAAQRGVHFEKIISQYEEALAAARLAHSAAVVEVILYLLSKEESCT